MDVLDDNYVNSYKTGLYIAVLQNNNKAECLISSAEVPFKKKQNDHWKLNTTKKEIVKEKDQLINETVTNLKTIKLIYVHLKIFVVATIPAKYNIITFHLNTFE
jgi:hypothetical protein